MLRPLFHFTVVAINSFIMYYDINYIIFPVAVKEMENLPLNSRIMFLTYWCLILQTVYHFFAFLNDLFGTNARTSKKPPILRRIKDTLFPLAFTAAIYVSLAFWSIYAIDKELIFPETVAKIYPPIFNHVMHTTVSLFIIIDLVSSYINYPSRKIGLPLILIFYICYVIWFFTIYVKTGTWVYPVFKPLNWPFRIVFVVLSVILAAGFYLVGEKLNYFISSERKDNLYANGIKNGIANGQKKRT